MSSILTEIIQLIVGGITEVASGIGTGLQALAKAIFLEEVTTSGGATVTQLSTFGGLVAIFAGISLAFGLSRWVLNFCTSLGQRNR